VRDVAHPERYLTRRERYLIPPGCYGYDIQQGHRTDSVELSDWDLLSETDRRSYFKKRFGVDFTDAVIAESRSGTDRFGEPLEYAGMETIIMSDGERVHYYASGCAGEVRRRLFGDELSAYYELAYYGAQKKNAGALRLVMEFDEVKDADQAWGTCMAAAGFEYIPVDVVTVEKAQQYVRADPNVSREGYNH
jgi:hypothetical protein